MFIKTVSTTSGINPIKFDETGGVFYWILNTGLSTIYASTKSAFTAGDDGVVSLGPKESRRLETNNDTIYILGEGQVEIHNQRDGICSFKQAPTSSGGGETIDAYTKTESDAKYAQKTDIPTSLPANGGNADTLDGLHSNEIAINPNLLINPDFTINQRESTEYSPARYTVDRWFNDAHTKVTVESDGITITVVQDINQEWWGVRQYIESIGQQYSNLPITVSAYISEFTGEWFIPTPTNSGNNRINITASGLNSMTFTGNYNRWFGIGAVNAKAGDYIKLKWMKVEVGSVATRFVTSDSILELMKCQRYYTTGEYAFDKTMKNVNYAIANVQFPVKMRTKPTVTLYSMIGTVNTISEWASHIDAINDVYANDADLGTSGFTSITSANSFVENAAYKFKYTADAEIY